MGESASVELFSAEVRVLQVGDGQITVSYKDVCAAPEAWHVRDKAPESVRQLDRARQLEMRQQRCTVDLDELERQWREKANGKLAEMRAAQAKSESPTSGDPGHPRDHRFFRCRRP
jgi:hypothetical protein